MTDGTWRGRVARFCHQTYVVDHLGLALLIAAYTIIKVYVEPFCRMFSLDDRSKSFPHALVERVSSAQNILYSGVAPLVILAAWSVLFHARLHQAHVSILGFLVSCFLASTLTDVIKNAVGRPRPDLIARCKPQLGTPAAKLVTIDVCTQADRHTLYEGWRSFPSGHSSLAFAGLGYLSLFIAGQWHIFRARTNLVAVLVFLAPLVGAALIAMSRLADYRHDIYDVTAGSLLGFGVAYFSYRRYYRRLSHPQCHEIYSLQGWRPVDLEEAGVVTSEHVNEEDEEEEAVRLLNRR